MYSALDVFNHDIFGVVSMTEGINKLPYVPSYLGSLGLFDEKGISTTAVGIEEKHGILTLIPTAARGTMPNWGVTGKRHVRMFAVPHIPKNDSVYADDVQGVRAFDSESALETVTGMVNDKMEALRQDHELTHEFHRLGAVKGVLLDADGTSVLYDFFDEFDITKKTVDFDFSVTTQGYIRNKCAEIERHVQDTLGMTPFKEIIVVVGQTFMAGLVAHPEVERAYERYLDGQHLRTSFQRGDFELFNLKFHEYRGALGADKFVPDAKGHAFPVGVPGLFRRYNAPGTFLEAANTVGKPLYAKQERMRFDVGTEIHTQSNPLHMITRPGVLVELTRTG